MYWLIAALRIERVVLLTARQIEALDARDRHRPDDPGLWLEREPPWHHAARD
jgi:hypothetical protein